MALPYQKSTTGGLCSQNKKTLCQLLFCFACTIGLRYTLTFQWCIMCARINKSLIRPEVDYDIIQYCRPILHFAKELSYRPTHQNFHGLSKRTTWFPQARISSAAISSARQLSPLIRWPVWFNRLPCRLRRFWVWQPWHSLHLILVHAALSLCNSYLVS